MNYCPPSSLELPAATISNATQMTKDEVKLAIDSTIREHLQCNAAIQESDVPAGLEGIFASALSSALTAKLGRIFDPKKESAPTSLYEVEHGNDIGSVIAA